MGKFWPTPQAQMPGAGPENSKVKNLLTGSRHSFYLTHAVEAERQQPGAIGSSPEASPARISVTPAKGLDWPERGRVFSTKRTELFASWDPESSSWKTCVRSLLGELETFSGRYPTSGMTVNGKLYERQTWVRRTDESGCGLLPTPKSTPSGPDFARAERDGSGGDDLATAAARFPTPTSNRRSGLQSHGVNVITGQLNPRWVDWLMGYPIGWTDLEASGMQLSLKSQS